MPQGIAIPERPVGKTNVPAAHPYLLREPETGNEEVFKLMWIKIERRKDHDRRH
jgi:hypothetical protein